MSLTNSSLAWKPFINKTSQVTISKSTKMYHIVNVSPEDLSKIKITNQQKIRDLTGSDLDLQKAFEVIKAESKGFTEENEKAKEADKLLLDLLNKNKVNLPEKEAQAKRSDGEENDRLRLREKERMRMLSLLELELQLSSQSK
jgi:hypothetical protein